MPVLSGLIEGSKKPFILTKIRNVRYWTNFKTCSDVNRMWCPSDLYLHKCFIYASFLTLIVHILVTEDLRLHRTSGPTGQIFFF